MTDDDKKIVDIGALNHRIRELLVDNDDLQDQCWVKDQVIRVLAERIAELEDGHGRA